MMKPTLCSLSSLDYMRPARPTMARTALVPQSRHRCRQPERRSRSRDPHRPRRRAALVRVPPVRLKPGGLRSSLPGRHPEKKVLTPPPVAPPSWAARSHCVSSLILPSAATPTECRRRPRIWAAGSRRETRRSSTRRWSRYPRVATHGDSERGRGLEGVIQRGHCLLGPIRTRGRPAGIEMTPGQWVWS